MARRTFQASMLFLQEETSLVVIQITPRGVHTIMAGQTVLPKRPEVVMHKGGIHIPVAGITNSLVNNRKNPRRDSQNRSRRSLPRLSYVPAVKNRLHHGELARSRVVRGLAGAIMIRTAIPASRYGPLRHHHAVETLQVSQQIQVARQAALVHILVRPERGMAGRGAGNFGMRTDAAQRLRPVLSVERAGLKEHPPLEDRKHWRQPQSQAEQPGHRIEIDNRSVTFPYLYSTRQVGKVAHQGSAQQGSIIDGSPDVDESGGEQCHA